jgi:hypothetical protein
MIKEIEKICPEEGMPNNIPINIYSQTQGMNTSTNDE